MADVRALLRQQREARRITHPHASYSDAGKLLCTLCRETVRSERLWENHIKGEGHRARVKQLHDPSNLTVPASTPPAAGPTLPLAKRKHPDDKDDDGADLGMEADDGLRRKRSKADMGTPPAPASIAAAGIEKYRKDQNHTPPSGHPARPGSVTPAHGIELNIPSRPATPATNREGSASSTPPGTGPSPHISQSMPLLPRRKTSDSTTNSNPSATSAPSTSAAPAAAAAATTTAEIGGEVDEAEWAAFEADIAATTAVYDESAVVSAPAMTAEEAAAAAAAAKRKSGDGEDQGQRTVSGEKILQDEMEDAARALEIEFEEMEALEEKFQKLKAKREALRIGQTATSVEGTAGVGAETTEDSALDDEKMDEDEDEEDDDDDDDDDGWNGFRFQR